MSGSGGHGHAEGSNRLYMTVWAVLLILSGVEVYLGYLHLAVGLMLVLLMGLSLIKAGLIIAYFMHLRYERRSLALMLMPALVFVVCMLFVFFPDSLRLLHMRPQ